jgi:hypothetical protein
VIRLGVHAGCSVIPTGLACTPLARCASAPDPWRPLRPRPPPHHRSSCAAYACRSMAATCSSLSTLPSTSASTAQQQSMQVGLPPQPACMPGVGDLTSLHIWQLHRTACGWSACDWTAIQPCIRQASQPHTQALCRCCCRCCLLQARGSRARTSRRRRCSAMCLPPFKSTTGACLGAAPRHSNSCLDKGSCTASCVPYL